MMQNWLKNNWLREKGKNVTLAITNLDTSSNKILIIKFMIFIFFITVSFM